MSRFFHQQLPKSKLILSRKRKLTAKCILIFQKDRHEQGVYGMSPNVPECLSKISFWFKQKKIINDVKRQRKKGFRYIVLKRVEE